jgi:hypothetical protein
MCGRKTTNNWLALQVRLQVEQHCAEKTILFLLFLKDGLRKFYD